MAAGFEVDSTSVPENVVPIPAAWSGCSRRIVSTGSAGCESTCAQATFAHSRTIATAGRSPTSNSSASFAIDVGFNQSEASWSAAAVTAPRDAANDPAIEPVVEPAAPPIPTLARTGRTGPDRS